MVDTQLKTLEVVEAPRELCQKPQERSVRHVTLKLPKGSKYRAGDHLEMLPANDPALVTMAIEALGLDPEGRLGCIALHCPLKCCFCAKGVVCWDPSKRQKKWRNIPMDDQLWAKMPALHLPVLLVITWFPDLAAVPDRKVIAWLARQTEGAASEELTGLAKDPEKYKAKVSSLNLSLAELLHKPPGTKAPKHSSN